MAISKQKKQSITARLGAIFAEATSVAFVRFSGLSVAETSALRKDLKNEGVGYYVAKKTLIKRALADANIAGETPDLPGEVSVAWTAHDATAPARKIYEFGAKHKGALAILGGVFEGMFADADKMNAIATIPSVPVLRGMFVNVINSPIQGLAIALKAIADKKAV